MVGKQPRNVKWEVNFVATNKTIVQTDDSQKGWGEYSHKISIGDQWNLQESNL